MRLLIFTFIVFPTLAFANVGDDINALLDRFFGGDQAPLEETIAPVETQSVVISDPVMEFDTVTLQREIMEKEAELEAFENDLRQQEQAAATISSQLLSSQQQLQLLDQQIELNRRKLDFYNAQNAEWKALVEKLTYDKSVLRAEIRILEREYKYLLSKNFIQKQNFQLNPTVSWWQWMFSDKSVSELLNERRQVSGALTQKSAGLQRLEQLKGAFDAQELEAVKAFAKVSTLKNQLLKDQVVLRDLADGKAQILKNLASDQTSVQSQLESFRDSQAESTQYLQTLRQSLRASGSLNNTEVVPPAFMWPLATPVRITASFKDAAYKKAFTREHLGLDMAASQGSDVLAAAEGVVSKVVTDGTGYTYIVIQHDPDLYTVYGHLSRTLVEKDDPVSAGQVIAWSGGTPGTAGAGYFTSGPHLHFEVFSGGQFVDPAVFLPEQ